jgi:hypothetical protein
MLVFTRSFISPPNVPTSTRIGSATHHHQYCPFNKSKWRIIKRKTTTITSSSSPSYHYYLGRGNNDKSRSLLTDEELKDILGSETVGGDQAFLWDVSVISISIYFIILSTATTITIITLITIDAFNLWFNLARKNESD